MAKGETTDVTKSSASASASASFAPFERAKRQLLLSCAAIGGGLAIAGTIDRTTGGVILLAGWLLGIVALHRLGRTGSERDQKPTR